MMSYTVPSYNRDHPGHVDGVNSDYVVYGSPLSYTIAEGHSFSYLWGYHFKPDGSMGYWKIINHIDVLKSTCKIRIQF